MSAIFTVQNSALGYPYGKDVVLGFKMFSMIMYIYIHI